VSASPVPIAQVINRTLVLFMLPLSGRANLDSRLIICGGQAEIRVTGENCDQLFQVPCGDLQPLFLITLRNAIMEERSHDAV
jgi:hypothetical protein